MNSLVKGLFSVFLVLALAVVIVGCGSNSNTSSSPESNSGSSGSSESSDSSTSSDSGGTESSESDSTFNPDKKPITIVAPSGAGGGWDLTARSMAQTLQDENLIDFPVQVVNEEGATGAVSLAQLVTQHAGSDEKISVTSLPLIVNKLMGMSDYGYKDVTMIARVMTEWFVVVVPADSPYQTLTDLLTAIKEDPQSVAVGASGDDRLPLQLMLDNFGGDPSSINFVTYEGGGEITNALLNGDVKASLTGVSEFRSQIEAGTLRGLAVTSEERLGDIFGEIPTATEEGIDVVFGNWRGFMGPPDMPEEALTFWQDTIEKAVQTDTWRDISAKSQWDITFMKGEEFMNFMDSVNSDVEDGLRKTGQIQ